MVSRNNNRRINRHEEINRKGQRKMSRNWNDDVTLSKATGQQCYLTKDLIKLFRQLEKDGYSGLSLGLIIDLIDNNVEEA